MKPTAQTLLLLIDALSIEYLKWMPFLQRLAEEGRVYAVRPAAGFRGVEPALNGEWTLPGEVPFRFRRDPSSSSRFPPGLPLGDRLLPKSANRLVRLLLSRISRTPYPFLIPANLLKHLSVSTGTARIPRLIRHWEESGKTVWWFTRDSIWENKKGLSARVYRKFYRQRMLAEGMNALREGKQIVYLEFSTLLDAVGHRHGPCSSPIETASRQLDRELEQWIRQAREICRSLSVGILSDHGMSEVNGTVDVEETLRRKGGWINGEDYLGVWNSNYGQVWPMKKELGYLEELLAETPHVRVLSPEERAMGFGTDPEYGEILLTAPEGTILLPNHFQGDRPVRGMHGYIDSETRESKALALFSGEGFFFPEEDEIEMIRIFEILKGGNAS